MCKVECSTAVRFSVRFTHFVVAAHQTLKKVYIQFDKKESKKNYVKDDIDKTLESNIKLE